MSRHVGRPTNEEVASRKRNKMLKIIIPSWIVVLAIIAIVGKVGLGGLMGNSVISTTSKAYLLGDLDNNGKVDAEDLTLLTNYLNNPDSSEYKLNEYQLAAANVNLDDNNEVNQEDANVLNMYINQKRVATTTSGSSIPSDIATKYVCPVNTETEEEVNAEMEETLLPEGETFVTDVEETSQGE